MTVVAKKIEKTDILNELLTSERRAKFACHPSDTKGRIVQEPESKTRSDFQRDRDRVIHSNAFRRLKHKTQVFVYHEGDHYRTRLTHSIEVSQVARSLARSLCLDEDLAEVCALAHDVGHTPFAHVGEDALKECMAPYGSFDHNDQTLRVLTMLEKRYPRYDGLNLTWETLEGLVKHNGPVLKSGEDKKLEITLSWLKGQTDLMLDTYASAEAQVAGISDDVAYNSHDLDDGLSAGLFTLDDFSDLPLIGEIVFNKRKEFPDTHEKILHHEVIREFMGYMVADVLTQTKIHLAELKPQSVSDVRHWDRQLISFSDKMAEYDKHIRAFLWERFYMHHDVSRMRYKVFRVVQDLFGVFMDHQKCLPTEWQRQIKTVPEGWTVEDWRARSIADYIASMTDKKALMEHRDLFDISAASH